MRRIVLIGLSGTGKSSVGARLAALLGFDFVDSDTEVARRFALPIAEIFARYGEPVFRAAEREVLRSAGERCDVVIATGGGAVVDPANWGALRPGSFLVHLTGSPEQIVWRLRTQVAQQPDERRPLLEQGDPVAALARLWSERARLYQQADVAVDTDGRSIEDLAVLIAELAAEHAAAGLIPATSIDVPTGRSDIYAAPGMLAHLGELARRRWPDARRAWIISDDHVLPRWGGATAVALQRADFAVREHAVPAGESSKSLVRLEELLDWLLAGKLDRRDIVVALGGGVVGDLAGFAAAIALRGVGLVQVPTSLLAMVDSGVGGKTAINHRLGKNLIGAFYQPELVLADTATLETLPPRERRAGWAEIVKHAMIERTATGAVEAALLFLLERSDERQLAEPDFIAGIVRRNVLIKAAVVRQDEREDGLRRILNYGHTLGHAMEAAGYRYLHGEAVALGMRAAARISLSLGRTEPEIVARQNALLDRLGLPERFEGNLADVLERMTHDKKAVAGTLTWVLLAREAGQVELSRGVPLGLVEEVAAALGAAEDRTSPMGKAML
ncbi:MAG TPA: 3-dehydroquinate synthase [Thermomicrobiaceae bacterium]|nr:3-dehydroquinate synthase [Thermomicrobiaceae bacterium]